jgi:hypothetical protein
MTSLLPWPSSYLQCARWSGVRRLLDRCHALSRDGALPATMMLLSEPGLGREALAVELAAMTTCRADAGPLCGCSSCERVRRGMHPDLQVLDVLPDNTEIKIKQVREELLADLQRLPYEGRRRVVIVASAHTPPLNAESASALLKALEEPPEHLVWLLLAANEARALPTIVSRSVLVRVPPPEPGELIELLAAVNELARPEAERHLRVCLDDAALALRTSPAEEVDAVAALVAHARALLDGDHLAALQLGALVKKAPHLIPVAVQALVRGADGLAPEAAEAALEAAARLLAADRRRAALHLDAESVVIGALARYLQK